MVPLLPFQSLAERLVSSRDNRQLIIGVDAVETPRDAKERPHALPAAHQEDCRQLLIPPESLARFLFRDQFIGKTRIYGQPRYAHLFGRQAQPNPVIIGGLRGYQNALHVAVVPEGMG